MFGYLDLVRTVSKSSLSLSSLLVNPSFLFVDDLTYPLDSHRPSALTFCYIFRSLICVLFTFLCGLYVLFYKIIYILHIAR